MRALPVHHGSEAERLAVLHATGLLDSSPDTRFDAITELAADLLAMPIALVSLVDDHRQWFKSRVGVSLRETPREQAFCVYAIEGDGTLADGLLVVPDATSDSRFAHNPLVTGPTRFRFYAGAPLTVRGQRLGTLCVIDTRSRPFDGGDRRVLQRLARMIEDLIVSRDAPADVPSHGREFRAILHACQDAMLVIDPDLQILMENAAARALFQAPTAQPDGRRAAPASACGLDILARVPTTQRQLWRDHLNALFNGSAKAGPIGDWRRMRGLRDDHTEFPVLATAGLAMLDGGPALVLTARDMTAAMVRESELRSAKIAAEAAAAARSRFLATVSHELRTPLNAIIGFTDLMMSGLHGPLNARYSEYIQHVRDAGGLLLSLVNDIMDISAIDHGGRTLSPELLLAAPEMNAVHGLLRKYAENRSLTLTFVADESAREAAIWADARALKQILHNLVGHAIKFTPPGGEIQLSTVLSDGRVLFQIADSGVGIDPRDQARLGGLFVRGRNIDPGQMPGAGLGLSICYRLAERMGAELTLDSALRRGTTAVLSFPRAEDGP